MAEPFVEDLAPDALVMLVGPSGSGKSTWAATRFAPEAILSSDAYRAQVAGDAADQSATADAFRILHAVAQARLRRGLLTVIDATNLTDGARRSLLRLAAKTQRPVVAVAFDLPLERCLAQNEARPGRRVPAAVIVRHHGELQHALAQLPEEGYDAIVRLRGPDMDRP
jgi:predicted kinase